MNSPVTPGSPTTSDSEIEEYTPQFSAPGLGGGSSMSGASSVAPNKRRLGGGGSQNPNGGKSRRREDTRRGGGWEGPHSARGGRTEKDESMIDYEFMNYLKRELGDPLNDGFSQVSS